MGRSTWLYVTLQPDWLRQLRGTGSHSIKWNCVAAAVTDWLGAGVIVIESRSISGCCEALNSLATGSAMLFTHSFKGIGVFSLMFYEA